MGYETHSDTSRMGAEIRKARAHPSDQRLLAEKNMERGEAGGIPRRQAVLPAHA